MEPPQIKSLCVGAGITLVGAALTVGGWDDESPVFAVGIALAVIGVCGMLTAALWATFCARFLPLDRMFELGDSVGYERGYREGRREGRPVLVPLACPHCGQPLYRDVG